MEKIKFYQQLKIISFIVCILTVLFITFFNISKHNVYFKEVMVFGDDPYDAVGSFGVQLAAFSALLLLIRVFRPYPDGISLENFSLIFQGFIVSLASIGVTLVVDFISLIRYASNWFYLTEGQLLAGVAALLLILTCLLSWIVIRFGRLNNLIFKNDHILRTIIILLTGALILFFYPIALRQSIPGELLTVIVGITLFFFLTYTISKSYFPSVTLSFEDLIDDLTSIYRSARSHISFLSRIFHWVDHVIDSSNVQRILNWLNPRKHQWNLIIILALIMGAAVLFAEIVSEGAPNSNKLILVTAVYISMEGLGVIFGYLLFNQFLGIVRLDK
jgi:hypothetical protein